MPSSLLNLASIRLFNDLYYRHGRVRAGTRLVHFSPFFFPLDRIESWNRLYGRKGFFQYQCVLPKAESLAGIAALLECVAATGQGSFLAVLKLFGPAGDGLLSFPMEGYTLALDFPLRKGTLALNFVPVLGGSAFKNKGVQRLLDGVIDYLPSPADVTAIEGYLPHGNGTRESRAASDDAPFSALAFKIMTDPFVGKLTYLRVYSGPLPRGSRLPNATPTRKDRAGRPLQMHSHHRDEPGQLHAAEEEDGEEKRRPAGHPDVGQEANDQGIHEAR